VRLTGKFNTAGWCMQFDPCRSKVRMSYLGKVEMSY
jgi:hypothetical protein